MAEQSNKPPMALTDECPKCSEKDFIVRAAGSPRANRSSRTAAPSL